MRSRTDRVLGLIGLATKAGKVMTGAQACETAIKNEKAGLVILAADASENTKVPITRLCGYKGVTLREFSDKESLGRYTGSPYRAVMIIKDPGFADKILEMIDENGNDSE
ncbi:MAG: L7Ae/L30e/S12e/Gadd45 family ribosomal protein [Saccharofermentanales bacterium]